MGGLTPTQLDVWVDLGNYLQYLGWSWVWFFLTWTQFRLGLGQGSNSSNLTQTRFNIFMIFITYIILYNNTYFLFIFLRRKMSNYIILYNFIFLFNEKYINLCLFSCYCLKILSYLLFKFSYKWIKKSIKWKMNPSVTRST